MGLLGNIFGKPKVLPVENIATLATAAPALAAEGYVFARKAGICLKKEGPTKLDLTGMLAGAALPARYDLAADEYGCTWIVLKGDPRGTVAAATRASRLLNDARRGGDILCIAFEFEKEGRKAYWIYSRKGLFYPFVPQDGEHDVLRELRMKETGSGIMPVENAIGNWHPLWGMPF
ncbi:MAG TPA: hypothetical protein VGJ92_06225 [Methanocella sp.]|jgi:hypothetical protein